MKRAVWNGEVIAQSDDIVYVEGNAYFPRESLKEGFFEESDHHTICPWKGRASYLSVGSAANATRTQLGTAQTRRSWRARSEIASPSGTASA